MAKFIIKHDKEVCIGCGACWNVCPDNWIETPDGKSEPKKTELDEIGCNQEAVDGCPVQCIIIEKVIEKVE